MAIVSRALSYQKLKREIWFHDQEDDCDIRDKIIGRYLRKTRLRRVHVRRKSRVTIPSLKRYLKRKTRLFRFAWNKVFKRLKESRSQFGDIFAGNSLLMQVSPTPLKCDENARPFVKTNSDDLRGFHASYNIPRIF